MVSPGARVDQLAETMCRGVEETNNKFDEATT